jgi:hypothetical protein
VGSVGVQEPPSAPLASTPPRADLEKATPLSDSLDMRPIGVERWEVGSHSMHSVGKGAALRWPNIPNRP